MKRIITKLKTLFKVSFLKTIRVNLKYFGVKYVFKPIILVSKNTKIYRLKGKVLAENKSFGAIRVGFGFVGIVDRKYRRTIWDNDGTLEFKGTSFMGVGTKISNTGHVTFGDNFCINANSDIICRSSIIFGEDVLISWETLIMDSDYHCIYSTSDSEQKRINPDKAIYIGNHCWIGCRCTLLKGTAVSNNTIIAAGSVISRCYKNENVIISDSGILKDNVNWKK